jgi:hypothetical protein
LFLVLRANLPTGSFGTIGRDLGQFITNFTPFQNPGGWHRPVQRQPMATEVSRDFSPP